MVLKPGREAEAERIFRKWELDFAIIGRTTDTSRLVIRHKGEVVADMPVDALSEEAPVYERPFTRKAKPLALDTTLIDFNRPPLQSLMKMLRSPDLCSRRWIWEQYDHSVMADTVQVPGGPAVDTGWIVYNTLNYPNLTALFAELGIATRPTAMSFAVSLGGANAKDLVWGSNRQPHKEDCICRSEHHDRRGDCQGERDGGDGRGDRTLAQRAEREGEVEEQAKHRLPDVPSESVV